MNLDGRFRNRLRLLLLLVSLVILGIVGGVYAQSVIHLPHDPVPPENLPPAKLAFLQQIEATQVAAETAIPPASKDLPTPTHDSRPQPTWPPGIFEDAVPPLPSEFYHIENMWQDRVNGSYVQVYAGLEQEKIDPSRGVLVVETTPLDGSPGSGGEYLTPIQVGSIHIVSADNPYLVVSAMDGSAQFVFNVIEHTWSPPTGGTPTAILPTVIPTASP